MHIPVIKGIQAGKVFYSGKVTFIELVRMFNLYDKSIPVELKAQRALDEGRAKAISKYILSNPDTYIIPAITASCDSTMHFEAMGEGQDMGLLQIPFTARLLVNDGQHRRKGIELALDEWPDLADESVTVSIYCDQGLKQAKQTFCDLNHKPVKPSSSLCLLYDQRNVYSRWILEVLEKRPAIKTRVDMENAAPGKKSDKLWSFIAFHTFVTLLTGVNGKNISTKTDVDLASKAAFVLDFLDKLETTLPMWKEMLDCSVSAEEIRNNYVHSHAVFLNALGMFGARLKDLDQMERLAIIYPSKTSPTWENRCVNRGKMQKNTDGIKTTAAVLMKCCGVEMPDDIARLDALCSGGAHAD
jgi:DNA sulfur modification protein DndB